MAEQSVVAVFDDMPKAEAAVRSLLESGVPAEQVSVVAKDLENVKEVHGFLTTKDVAKSGAKGGAWVGGIFGLLVGAAFIWVPGVGPLLVAGPLAAALLGGLEGALGGAAYGGLLGALAGWGIDKDHVIKYEETVKGGKYLVIAHGTADIVAKAKPVLDGSGADTVADHAEA
jgi:hypothetical protein